VEHDRPLPGWLQPWWCNTHPFNLRRTVLLGACDLSKDGKATRDQRGVGVGVGVTVGTGAGHRRTHVGLTAPCRPTSSCPPRWSWHMHVRSSDNALATAQVCGQVRLASACVPLR